VLRIALPIALCVATSAFAQSEPGTSSPTFSEAWQPPRLTTTRYDEHYEQLADPAARDDHWTEPFKYIPIGDDGAYLTTGIELRARNEAFRNNAWEASSSADDGYLWLRAVPYADLHVGRVRGFVQPIAAYAVGVASGPGPIDQTRVDLLQSFADVRLGEAETGRTDATGVTLRAGRQMLSLGSERLIGTRYGVNVPLAFDGFRSLVSFDGALLNLIALRPVQSGPGTFDDRRSRARSLYGAYLTMPKVGLSSGLDLYWLGYENEAARFGGILGNEERHSIGARFFGKSAGWRWNVEGVYQFGDFADGKISAWTVGSEVGYALSGVPLTPDFTLRFNVISGDKRAGDHRLGTFNALFPRGKYFGELSPVGPTNIVNLNPSMSFTLSETVSAAVAGMAYWRYSRGDGVYDVPGNLIRAPGNATARFIGKQVEATLSWQATTELELSTSLSAFEPGDFIRQTGTARTITMLGLEANFRF
jgi:hypothetical protein